MGGVVAIRVKIAGNEERLDPFEFLCKRPGRSGRRRLQVRLQLQHHLHSRILIGITCLGWMVIWLFGGSPTAKVTGQCTFSQQQRRGVDGIKQREKGPRFVAPGTGFTLVHTGFTGTQ